MPQKIDSQKLSQLAGQPVEITVNDGESLEQAEARVIGEHPDLFGGEQDFAGQMADASPSFLQNKTPAPKQVNPAVAAIAQEGLQSGATTTEGKRGLDSAKVLEDILGIKDPTKLNAGITAEDLAQIPIIQGLIKKMLETKNSGFGGQGIDTGPMVGGNIPVPFKEDDPKWVPSGINEWWNQTKMGGNLGEASADRATLRQQELDILNPLRKQVTGAGATVQELLKFIFPAVATESDNDKAFFNKGLNSLEESQRKFQILLEALQRSGIDMSGFNDVKNISPEQVKNDLLKTLTANPKGSYSREFPQATKSFLQNMLSNKGQEKATHRFNPQTGKVEVIQ